MDFLKNQIRRIQDQLAGLSASQKMLAAALLVIMLMTLYWWAMFAGKAEMESVLEQSLTPDDITVITSRLRALSIPYKTVGDRIQVPADRKDEVLADLAYSQLLPRDTKNAFDEIIAKSSPFYPSKMQDRMWNEAKSAFLASLIRRFPKVSHAAVVIDDRRERGPGGVEPSATVNLTMRSGETPDPRLINAAADLVAGGVANLSRGRIKVIVNGVSYPVRSNDDSMASVGDEYLAQVQKAEKYYADKLARQFSWIDGTMISVTVKPNFERVEKVDHKVDPKNVLQKAVNEENTTEENRTSSKSSGEPGMASNAPLAINEPAAGGDSSSNTGEKNKTEYKVDAGTTDTKTFHPGGDLTVTAASVLIPRSYFSLVYRKRTNTSDKEPDPKILEDFIKSELSQVVKPTVRTCLGLADEQSVHVDAYTDLVPVVTAAAPQAASSTFSLSLGDHVKEIALGVLALVSLFMISNMVKKSSPAPAAPPPPAPKVAPQLMGGEEAIGEATDGNPLLDGMELDEESVKAQQMLDQVSKMVEDNPDAAAALVKRWLNRA